MATPEMMKAFIQKEYGELSQVLEIRSVPVPFIDASSDKLLLRVKAVSVNPLDYLLVKGGLKFVWADAMPTGVGVDVSGVVVQAGKGTGFKVGDEVFGGTNMHTRGSMAEYCVVLAANCALKPKALTHEEASCLPVVGLTALQAFRRHTGPKETALIPAGLGGVGHIALQLAKPYAGFKHTITTASTSKVPLVKEHIKDVDKVIDYKTSDPLKVIPAGSVDFVLDTFTQSPSFVPLMRKPAAGSKTGKPSIISIATPPNRKKAEEGWETKVSFLVGMLLNAFDWWTRFWIPNWIHYDSFFALSNQEDLTILARLADEGKLKPVIDEVYPLDQALEALARAESKPAGKVVIRVDE